MEREIALCLAFVTAWCAIKAFRRKRRRRRGPLDRALFTWPDGTCFTVADLNNSVAIFGTIGSGKSTASGLAFFRAVVGLPNSGGLILASNPNDKEFWTALFAEAGRLDDLIVFDAKSDRRWNFIDKEMEGGGDSHSLTQFIVIVGETLNEGKRGGDNAAFWQASEAREIYCTVEALRQALGRVTGPEIQKFISSAPQSAAALGRPENYEVDSPERRAAEAYRAGFHYKAMGLAAQRRERTDIERNDYELILDYWYSHYIKLDMKVRSSVEAGIMNTIHVFNTGIVREIASTTTNASAADYDKKKWHLFDFPISRHGASGKFLYAAAKFSAQKHVLRNSYKPGDPTCTIVADEAWHVANPMDAEFISESRKHGGSLIYLTQSVNNYVIAMGDEKKADVLLGQFGHRVFHSADPATAEYGSRLIGSAMQATGGGSQQAPKDMFDSGAWSSSISEGIRPLVEPREFMTGLRRGGEANGRKVDAIVVRSEPFADGRNYQIVTFEQEKK